MAAYQTVHSIYGPIEIYATVALSSSGHAPLVCVHGLESSSTIFSAIVPEVGPIPFIPTEL